MADTTREERQEVAAMNVEEQKEAVEGADNAIARRLRVLQMSRRAPAPVTPVEPQNTPIALALKACEERVTRTVNGTGQIGASGAALGRH